MIPKISLIITGFFAVLFFSGLVNAALQSSNIEITINDDGTTNWAVSLTYPEPVSRSDYWLFSRITELDVFSNDVKIVCNLDQGNLGTLISCPKLNSDTIIYTFKTQSLSEQVNDFSILRYTFNIVDITQNFSVTAKLPVGAALVEPFKLKDTPLAPFGPDFGQQNTDGRRIFLRWDLQNPPLGQALNVHVVYEKVKEASLELLLGLILATAVALGVLFYLLRHLGPRKVLPILNESERKVVQLLMKTQSMDQREIVKQTDFSKAKVSRVIKDLESRGLVESTRRGRVNKVRLTLGKAKITQKTAEESNLKQKD